MNSLKTFVLQQLAKNEITQEQAKEMLLEISQSSSNAPEEIAIIGMSGRFPQSSNVEEFWELLRDGVNCIRDFPEHRKADFKSFVENPHYMDLLNGKPIEPEDIDEVYAKAGYMKEIDKFDADFFGLPPTEALYMDPQQRIALETAWSTMEDAGYGGDKLIGSNTGVYIGKETTNFSLYRYYAEPDPMQLTGSWESVMASRISYLFNLHGPCMMVDTACSAGLVSIHMAANAIRAGECDQAIAGGINVVMSGEFKTHQQVIMNMDSVESDDGLIRTFDGDANGTVWGEGLGFVLLKPLSKALEDGDNIHAVIKGSAINNDGASNGLTAPNADSQKDVILSAWENANINPETLSYIEAHGTGTVLGDPIEIKGLTSAFKEYTDRNQFCAIGSLKPNMGHLVGSSGAAGLFKIICAMKHKTLPPTINFNRPNPYINFIGSPLYVTSELQDWKTDGIPRRAGINSFGFSHTNCHMVIEEAPERSSPEKLKSHYCLSISTKKRELLLDYINRYESYLENEQWSLADACFTSNTGRGHYEHRLAIVAQTESELKAALATAKAFIENSEDSLEPIAVANIYYASHQIVSDKKKNREQFELTENEKRARTLEVKDLLTQYVEQNDDKAFAQAVELYTKGADLDWDALYQNEARLRLPVPTYPYEQKRVWPKTKQSNVTSFQSRLHPLIDGCKKQSDNEWIYESIFDAKSHWVLADHKIQQTPVVPGTTYLEMARAAATLAKPWNTVELCDIYFLQPMVVPEGEPRRVRVSLIDEDGEGKLKIYIESIAKKSSDSEWQTHFEGFVQVLESDEQQAFDLDKVKENADLYEETYEGESDTGVFQFGPHWQTVTSFWNYQGNTLALLNIPGQFGDELNDMAIHPSMLDNAMNLTSQDTGETYLPFMYKSFKLYKGFEGCLYSYIVPTSSTDKSAETHSYDVQLINAAGEIIGEATGYYTKKVHNFNFDGAPAQNEALKAHWVNYDAALTSDEAKSAKKLLVLIPENADFDQTVLPTNVEAQLVEVKTSDDSAAPSGPNHVICSQEGFDALGQSDLLKNIDGIVFYDAQGNNEEHAFLSVSNDAVVNNESATAHHASFYLNAPFFLAKALLNQKVELKLGINLFTQSAFKVNGKESNTNPFALSSAMMLVSVGMENTNLPIRVVDLEKASELSECLEQLSAIQTGRLLAKRDDNFLTRELQPFSLESSGLESSGLESKTLQYHDDSTYIITGGLGGLGIATAQYIAQQANANVVLLGRSALPEKSQWQTALDNDSLDDKAKSQVEKLVQLNTLPITVDYRQADVTDAQAVQTAIESIKAQYSNIRGVFHEAGVAGDGFILRKEFDTYSKVLAPKVYGTLNLIRALANESLDFIVNFSSIMAITGGEGQADYASANAFMDGCADLLNNSPLKMIAINWSSLSDVGMAVDYQLSDDMTPFKSLESKDAFDKLDRIVASNNMDIIPSDINAEFLAGVVDSLPVSLSHELMSSIRQAQRKSGGDDLDFDNLEIDIRGKSEEELTQTEKDLAKLYAVVLGLGEVDVFTSFQDMGGNSMIAAQLLKVIDEHYKGMVDISDIFSYPTIDEMAEYLNEKLGISTQTDADEESEENTEEDWENIIDAVADGDGSIEDLLEKL